MLPRLVALLMLAVLPAGASVASASAPSEDRPVWTPLYSNPLQTGSQQAEIHQFDQATDCRRKTPRHEFEFRVASKNSHECEYRIPAGGKSLRAIVTGRMTGSTPKGSRQRAYLSVAIRPAGGGARYRIRIFPRTGRFSLTAESWDLRNPREREVRRITGGDRSWIHGIGRLSRFGLRAYSGVWNVPNSRVRVVAMLAGRSVAAFTVPRRDMARGIVTFGAGRSDGQSGHGVGAAFRNIRVSAPTSPG